MSPVLGQHQIKPAEFIPQFNSLSEGYTPGTPLGVQIHKSGSKWTLRVAPPSVGVLLGGAARGGRLCREGLWGALTFRPGGVTPPRARTLLGTLRSLGFGVR